MAARKTSPIKNLVGQRFAKLLVTADSGMRDETGRVLWNCLCDCGKSRDTIGADLKVGRTTSCGCAKAERVKKAALRHGSARAGDKRAPEYRSWTSMIVRCTNKNYHYWHRYGGRGITVCDRWRENFERFLADMGQRPPGTTLDRYPNPDGNYEPGNCRWATRAEQRNNRGTQ